MTQQAPMPTRRARRAAAPSGVAPLSVPTQVSVPTQAPSWEPITVATVPPVPAPVTRRALREAERSGIAVVPTQAMSPESRSHLADRGATATPAATSSDPAPVTRRELRLAAQEAERRRRLGGFPAVCRPPFAASLVLPAQQVRPSQARAVVSRLGARPLAVVALSVSMLGGAVTQVHAEQTEVAAQAAAERADRLERVSAARHATQAAAIAANTRMEALAVAEQAVDAAQEVHEMSSDVVDAETLATLEIATAQLSELLGAAPEVEVHRALSEPAPITSDEAQPSTAPETEADGEQAEGLDDGEATDTEPASADDPSTQPEATTSPDDAATQPQDPPVPDRSVRPSRSDDAAVRAPLEERAPSTDPTAAEMLRAIDVGAIDEQLAALDLDTSAKILAAAAQVTELSAEVAETADTILAELAAKAAAEAAAAEEARLAAEEAERQAAAELARKIEVVKASTNGEIPADAMCGVAFQSGVQLRCDAAASLEKLNTAYRADFGRDLRVVSSYRSYPAQVATKRTRGYLAATPGTSNHGLGIAVDFGDFGGVGNFSTANHRWMRENGPAFGWHHPAIMRPGGGGPQEPWHFEFEG